METKSRDIYFAASLEDACAALQTIVNTAKEYGNCLTDKVYRTDYITRREIVRDFCYAYYDYIGCVTGHEDAGAAVSERAAALDKVISDNVRALPAAIKEYLKMIEAHDVEIDGDETDGDFDSVTRAADDAAKTADKDIDYTYKTRLATAAMNAYCGIYGADDLDPSDIYTGLRLTAIKLYEAINTAVDSFSFYIYHKKASTSLQAGLIPAVNLTKMAMAVKKARVLLFGFTGVDNRKAEPPHFDGDWETTQLATIINLTFAKSESAEIQLSELCFDVCDLPDIDLEQVKERLYKALTALRKLAEEACNMAPEQQEPGVGDICSSGVVGNAMKE